MTEQNKISFDNSEIAILFPFYFAFDDSLKIISAGNSIKKLIPNIVDSDFQAQFGFKRPFSVSYSFNSITEFSNQVVIIVVKKIPDILLRGQIMQSKDNSLIFIGSPWITKTEDLQKFKLNIPDFAIHDSTTDMLQLLNNKELMSKDILLLVDDLKKQKREIEKSESNLKYSNKRFSALIQNMQSGILLEDKNRKIVLVNKIFCEIFKIPATPEQMVGYDCKASAEESKHQFKNPTLFLKRVEKILADKNLVQNEELEMSDGVFLARDFVPIFSDNEYNGHLWIYRNITERKKNEIELVYAKEQAIIERKAKEQFLANMSHELRNPINIVTGITGLLYDTNLSSKQNEYLGIIRIASENLLTIVNDILDFEKIQAKKIKFHVIPFDMLKLVNEVYMSMKYLAKNKNLTLNLEIDGFLKTHHVSGDPLRLKQILFNLVNNALKFTDFGSIDVRISMEKSSGMVKFIKIEVSDTGIGISKENLPLIFSRYSQVESDASNFSAGTGLGLTIVKNLVELQKGTIDVKSKLSLGTTFYVSIPYEIIEHLEKPVAIEKPKVIDLSSKRVLVVEDDKFNQIITTSMLEKHGAVFETADNGEIAIEKLRIGIYDIILLDLQMPILNGYKTAEKIRGNLDGTFSEIPIIAITANILSGEKEKCIAAGMNDYLSKPFSTEELIQKISDLLAIVKPIENVNLLDLDYLKSTAQGNLTFYKNLITEFLSQTPVIMDELKRLVVMKDWENAEKAAHKLKGRISFIGTPDFIKTVSVIETYCQKLLNLNLLPGMVDKLETYCVKIYSELTNELYIIKL